MESSLKKANMPSNQLVWNEENAIWYAEQYGDHISNDLTINNIDLNSNDILLDIGCGIGTAVKIASKKCHDGMVYGIDPTETMINIAKKDLVKTSNIKFSIGSAENIPLEDESVNKIIAINSIHHWNDYNKGFFEVNRVLESGGSFFISNDKVDNNDCGHGKGPLETNEYIMRELNTVGFTHITLHNYTFEDEGIHLIRSKKV